MGALMPLVVQSTSLPVPHTKATPATLIRSSASLCIYKKIIDRLAATTRNSPNRGLFRPVIPAVGKQSARKVNRSRVKEKQKEGICKDGSAAGSSLPG